MFDTSLSFIHSLCLIFCFSFITPLKSSQPKEDEAAKRKKTDAPTPDDARSAEKEEKEEKSPSKQQEKSFIAPADEVEEVKYFHLCVSVALKHGAA